MFRQFSDSTLDFVTAVSCGACSLIFLHKGALLGAVVELGCGLGFVASGLTGAVKVRSLVQLALLVQLLALGVYPSLYSLVALVALPAVPVCIAQLIRGRNAKVRRYYVAACSLGAAMVLCNLALRSARLK